MLRAVSQVATQKEHSPKNLEISQKTETVIGGVL